MIEKESTRGERAPWKVTRKLQSKVRYNANEKVKKQAKQVENEEDPQYGIDYFKVALFCNFGNTDENQIFSKMIFYDFYVAFSYSGKGINTSFVLILSATAVSPLHLKNIRIHTLHSNFRKIFDVF